MSFVTFTCPTCDGTGRIGIPGQPCFSCGGTGVLVGLDPACNPSQGGPMEAEQTNTAPSEAQQRESERRPRVNGLLLALHNLGEHVSAARGAGKALVDFLDKVQQERATLRRKLRQVRKAHTELQRAHVLTVANLTPEARKLLRSLTPDMAQTLTAVLRKVPGEALHVLAAGEGHVVTDPIPLPTAPSIPRRPPGPPQPPRPPGDHPVG